MSELPDDELVSHFLGNGPCIVRIGPAVESAASLSQALAMSFEAVRDGRTVMSIECLGQFDIRPPQIFRLLRRLFGEKSHGDEGMHSDELNASNDD